MEDQITVNKLDESIVSSQEPVKSPDTANEKLVDEVSVLTTDETVGLQSEGAPVETKALKKGKGKPTAKVVESSQPPALQKTKEGQHENVKKSKVKLEVISRPKVPDTPPRVAKPEKGDDVTRMSGAAKRRQRRARVAQRLLIVDVTDFPALTQVENKVYQVPEAMNFLKALNVKVVANQPAPVLVRKPEKSLTRRQIREQKLFGRVITQYDPNSGAVLVTSDSQGQKVVPLKSREPTKDGTKGQIKGKGKQEVPEQKLNRKARRALKFGKISTADVKVAKPEAVKKIVQLNDLKETPKVAKPAVVKTEAKDDGWKTVTHQRKIDVKVVKTPMAEEKVPVAQESHTLFDQVMADSADDIINIYRSDLEPGMVEELYPDVRIDDGNVRIDPINLMVLYAVDLLLPHYRFQLLIDVWPEFDNFTHYHGRDNYFKSGLAPHRTTNNGMDYGEQDPVKTIVPLNKTHYPSKSKVFIGLTPLDADLIEVIYNLLNKENVVHMLGLNLNSKYLGSKNKMKKGLAVRVKGSAVVYEYPQNFMLNPLKRGSMLGSKDIYWTSTQFNDLFVLFNFSLTPSNKVAAHMFSSPEEVLVNGAPHILLDGEFTPKTLVDKTSLSMLGRDVGEENYKLTMRTAARHTKDMIDNGEPLDASNAILAADLVWADLRRSFWSNYPWKMVRSVITPYNSLTLLPGASVIVSMTAMLGIGALIVVQSRFKLSPYHASVDVGQLIPVWHKTYSDIIGKDLSSVDEYLLVWNSYMLGFINKCWDVLETPVIGVIKLVKRFSPDVTSTKEERQALMLNLPLAMISAPITEEILKKIHWGFTASIILWESWHRYFVGIPHWYNALLAGLHIAWAEMPLPAAILCHSASNGLVSALMMVKGASWFAMMPIYPLILMSFVPTIGHLMPGIHLEEVMKHQFPLVATPLIMIYEGSRVKKVYGSYKPYLLPAIVHVVCASVPMEPAMIIHCAYNLYVVIHNGEQFYLGKR